MEPGLIHVYHGDGKGKTTAAIGLAARFVAYSPNIIFCQFLKSTHCGELDSLARLNITVMRADIPAGFTWNLTAIELKKMKISHDMLLDKIIEFCKTWERGLLILDEIIGAFDKKLVDKKKLLNFLDNKPPRLEIVMTGRNPAQELLERADYITEMKKIKHPLDIGINARIGIEK